MSMHLSDLQDPNIVQYLADREGFIPQPGDAPEKFNYPASMPWVKSPDQLERLMTWHAHLSRCHIACTIAAKPS